MLSVIFFYVLSTVVAEWPPSNCNIGTHGKDVVLTSSSVAVSSCAYSEKFERNVYAQISRTHGRSTESSESSFEIDLMNAEEFASIQLSDTQIILDEDNACSFQSVQRGQRPFWIHIRMKTMLDSRKTHIRVGYSDRNDGVFEHCGSITLNVPYYEFQLTFEAESKNGMRQIVHAVTTTKPKNSQEDMTELVTRIDRLELRLERLQSVVAKYIDDHDRHRSATLDQQEYLKKAIAGTHNRIETRTNAHGLFYIFMFVIVLLCGFTYTRLKHLDERRFHMT